MPRKVIPRKYESVIVALRRKALVMLKYVDAVVVVIGGESVIFAD